MKQLPFKFTILLAGILFTISTTAQPYTIKKGNVTYDFTFAELSVRYLETGDSTYLQKIADCDGAKHILSHSNWSNNTNSQNTLTLVKKLLTPREKLLPSLEKIRQNIKFAKDSIAQVDLSQKEALHYLPANFNFSSHLYFTVGYDLGVVFENNSSLNLAHPHYLKDANEMKYYSIHELHHAGFVLAKNRVMPSLAITTHAQMTELIEYLTHLEGMATYAALDLRTRQNAINNDEEYIALQNCELMVSYEKEYFEIYRFFKETPNQKITDDDWDKVNILSDKRRLWYRVGALMAQTIDKKMGRETLTQLIAKPSVNFTSTYLDLQK